MEQNTKKQFFNGKYRDRIIFCLGVMLGIILGGSAAIIELLFIKLKYIN